MHGSQSASARLSCRLLATCRQYPTYNTSYSIGFGQAPCFERSPKGLCQLYIILYYNTRYVWVRFPKSFRGVFFLSCCRPNQRPVSLHQRLLVDAVDADDERGIPQELLSELVARFDEEPDIVPYFAEAMKALSTSLSNMDLTDNFKPYIYALARLVAIKRLANQFTSLDDFLPSSCVTRPTAERIEQETLLGPFFRISPLQVFARETHVCYH